MSARSVWSGTRPSRYHSQAISMPFRRPERHDLMPWAPRRIAFCIARFIARRNAMRSELLGDVLGDQLASISGLAHLDVHGRPAPQAASELGLQVLDVLALLADHHARTPSGDGDAGTLGRALDQDARHGGAFRRS